MFDQVLVRPSLIDNFEADRTEIVDRVGSVSLLGTGSVPDKAVGSDHLPLLFSMRL
jgi:hypothetical protein